jgi:hypothetical protein
MVLRHAQIGPLLCIAAETTHIQVVGSEETAEYVQPIQAVLYRVAADICRFHG